VPAQRGGRGEAADTGTHDENLHAYLLLRRCCMAWLEK
jgi:hypothetical protein